MDPAARKELEEKRIQEEIKIRTGWLLPFLLYYLILILILFQHLDALKMPVILYGGILCSMVFFAFQLTSVKYRPAGSLIMMGALSFLLSDTLLALNKFYQPFTMAGTWIMISYALAQFLFVTGGIRVINKVNAIA